MVDCDVAYMTTFQNKLDLDVEREVHIIPVYVLIMENWALLWVHRRPLSLYIPYLPSLRQQDYDIIYTMVSCRGPTHSPLRDVMLSPSRVDTLDRADTFPRAGLITLDENVKESVWGKKEHNLMITNPSSPKFCHKDEGELLAGFELSPNTPRDSKKYE